MTENLTMWRYQTWVAVWQYLDIIVWKKHVYDEHLFRSVSETYIVLHFDLFTNAIHCVYVFICRWCVSIYCDIHLCTWKFLYACVYKRLKRQDLGILKLSYLMCKTNDYALVLKDFFCFFSPSFYPIIIFVTKTTKISFIKNWGSRKKILCE